MKKLYDLNSKISEETSNLTRALKGDVKKQGNWGEVVLERILERSGLNEGEQGYQKQFSDTTEDGKPYMITPVYVPCIQSLTIINCGHSIISVRVPA